jgi:hypothetical protein
LYSPLFYRVLVDTESKDFYLPFGGKLNGENRWVTLSKLIPWEKYESEYAEQFNKEIGAPAKPFRVALGALIIKERLGTSDKETVEQIRENPYLQYFLGLTEYTLTGDRFNLFKRLKAKS